MLSESFFFDRIKDIPTYLFKMVEESDLNNLSESLEILPQSMNVFATMLEALYKNGVFTDSNWQEMTRVRDNIRDKAIVYSKVILPKANKFVSNFELYFENYTELSFEEWEKSLDDIINETKEHEIEGKTIVDFHKKLLTDLRKDKDELLLMEKAKAELGLKYLNEAKKLQEKAKTKRKWAVGLSFVPLINVLVLPVIVGLDVSSISDMVKCRANTKASIDELSCLLLIDTIMIPALDSFIEGMESSLGVLNVIRQSLEQMIQYGEKAGAAQNKKRLYKIMNGKAKKLITDCRNFYAAFPIIESYFDSIPVNGADNSYITSWMNQNFICDSK